MLLAVDTNVPIDLVNGLADVVDSLGIIRERIPDARLIAPPTVVLELAYLGESADEDGLRAASKSALRSLFPRWRIQPINSVPAGRNAVEAIAAKIRERDLLPSEEINDSQILVEAAMLECSMLLTSDAHLRGVDHASLSLLLRESQVRAPVIATPREIVRKFFR